MQTVSGPASAPATTGPRACRSTQATRTSSWMTRLSTKPRLASDTPAPQKAAPTSSPLASAIDSADSGEFGRGPAGAIPGSENRFSVRNLGKQRLRAERQAGRKGHPGKVSPAGEPAVHTDYRAGHQAGSLGGQKEHGTGDFFRLTHSAHRRVRKP